MLVNSDFWEIFPSSEVQHLFQQESDYAPFHVIFKIDGEIIITSFRFLIFWCKHKDFKALVQ